MALLEAHLLEQARKLPASLLIERIGRDLERFRAEGWELPQAASAYLADWLAAGWLERSLSRGGRGGIRDQRRGDPGDPLRPGPVGAAHGGHREPARDW